MPGPVPMREDDLARPRTRGQGKAAPEITRGELFPVKVPSAPRDWHPIAKKLFNGLKTSGQSAYYQNSDWALAYSLCDDLSRFKQQEEAADHSQEQIETWYDLTPDERVAAGMDPKRPPRGHKGGSAMKLVSIYGALERLLVTEGDRRRLRLELKAPVPQETPAEVLVMEEYRRNLGVAQ